jgi:hypothetical protein
LQDQAIWNYFKDLYVHQFLQKSETLFMSLPDQIHQSGCQLEMEVNNEKEIQQFVDEKLVECSYWLSQQLDLQRSFYEEQLDDEEHGQIHSEIIVFIIFKFILV